MCIFIRLDWSLPYFIMQSYIHFGHVKINIFTCTFCDFIWNQSAYIIGLHVNNIRKNTDITINHDSVLFLIKFLRIAMKLQSKNKSLKRIYTQI